MKTNTIPVSRKTRLNPSAAKSLAFLIILLSLPACRFLTPDKDAAQVILKTSPASSTSSADPALIEAYFSDPYDPNAHSRPGYLDDILVYAIDQAGHSVDMAILNLTSDEIGEALLRAHRRGVNVRLVMESEKIDSSIPQGLLKAGIPIVGDNNDGLMHHKFIIIDSTEVWTGSMNFTDSGVFKDHNNMLRIRSSRLAKNYQVEFEEMFTDRLFGSGSPSNTPHPSLTINGIQIKNYFSPDDHVQDQLLTLIYNAQKHITVMAFAFTADPLAEALIQKAADGVQVEIIMDHEQAYSNQGGEYQNFLDQGLDVRLDTNKGQMHHKVMIIDDQIVASGSYNYSRSAEDYNDENLIVIYSPNLAEAYTHEFYLIYDRAE